MIISTNLRSASHPVNLDLLLTPLRDNRGRRFQGEPATTNYVKIPENVSESV